jgi:hypothetical protein
MGIGVSDITIIFSTNNDKNPLTMDDKATVRLAPTTAKILLENLQMAVAVYEGQFGTIPVPPRLMAQLESHRQLLARYISELMTQSGPQLPLPPTQENP